MLSGYCSYGPKPCEAGAVEGGQNKRISNFSFLFFFFLQGKQKCKLCIYKYIYTIIKYSILNVTSINKTQEKYR